MATLSIETNEAAKLQEGLSVQYGTPASKYVGESVWYNFLAYPNGEVQIRGSKDSVKLSDDAFLELVELYCKARGVVLISTPSETRQKMHTVLLSKDSMDDVHTAVNDMVRDGATIVWGRS